MRDREAAALTGAALLAALSFPGGSLLASGALAALGVRLATGWWLAVAVLIVVPAGAVAVRRRRRACRTRLLRQRQEHVKSFLGRFGYRSGCRAAASLAQSLPHVFMGYPVDFGAGDGLHSRRSDTCSPARGARFRALNHRLVVARS